MKEKRNLPYILLQSSYWMSFCVCICFAVNYLQGSGFSNTLLGIISAAGNLLGMIAGPFLAAKMDEEERCSPLSLYPVLLAGELVCALFLLLMRTSLLVQGLFYVLLIGFSVSVNTPLLKIYADLSFAGCQINYALARGLGSLSFVAASALTGVLFEKYGPPVLPWEMLACVVYQYLSYLAMKKKMPRIDFTKREDRSSSLPLFVERNLSFFVMLCGSALLFFAHNNITGFLINVVTSLGGNHQSAGFLNSFMALVELPVMFAYASLFGNRDPKKLLAFSFFAFSVKGLCFALSFSLSGLYLSYLLQAPSFALYSSSIVPYVEKTIAYEDAAKAQSLAYTMTTLGSVLSNAIGGRLYDTLSVSRTLWISFLVSCLGSAVCLFAMYARKRGNDEKAHS